MAHQLQTHQLESGSEQSPRDPPLVTITWVAGEALAQCEVVMTTPEATSVFVPTFKIR